MTGRLFEYINKTLYLVAIVGILALLYGVLDRYHPRVDLTKAKLFTIAPQTKKVLKNLKKDVAIKAYVRTGTSQAMQIKDLLKEYKARSKHIKFKMVDIDRDKLQVVNAGVRKINTVVFTSGEKRKDVQPENIFGYGRSRQQEFKGEIAFTAAIMEVTSKKKKRLCFVTGHGEKSIETFSQEGVSVFKEGLEKENYQVKSFPIAQRRVIAPECDGVLVLGPTTAYLKEEADLLKQYLKKGGRALMTFDPLKGKVLPFLKEFGISPQEGTLVLDPSRSIALRGPASIVPSVGNHPSVRALTTLRTGLYFFEAMPITVEEDAEPKAVSLFETSPQSYTKEVAHKKNIQVKYDAKTDKKGKFVVGAAVESGKMRLIVLGDTDFLSNVLVNDFNHLDAGVNMVNWMMQEEQNISIRPKSAERRELTLERSQLRWIAWTVLLFTPFILLILAGWLFWRRRTL